MYWRGLNTVLSTRFKIKFISHDLYRLYIKIWTGAVLMQLLVQGLKLKSCLMTYIGYIYMYWRGLNAIISTRFTFKFMSHDLHR